MMNLSTVIDTTWVLAIAVFLIVVVPIFILGDKHEEAAIRAEARKAALAELGIDTPPANKP